MSDDWIPVPGIKTAANYPLQSVYQRPPAVTPPDPVTGATVCQYTHFDLTTEELGATSRYNCWAFTFLPRRYWLNDPADVDRIIQDNCSPVTPGNLQPGDVIRYKDDYGITTHTGRVWEVQNGQCTLVRSKWGSMAEYIHDPLNGAITPFYGTNLDFFRQHAPIHGRPDIWLRDSPYDEGDQFQTKDCWTSPELLVDAPPYGGGGDPNPVYGVANRVWTKVRNRSDTDAANLYVRYYWGAPHIGLDPAHWNLIGVVGPFGVPANSIIDAPYVEWTPTDSDAHQCLFAIAYFDDNPDNSDNPDPLVYPFDVAGDNNIAWRNYTVIEMKSGQSKKFKLKADVPRWVHQGAKPHLHLELEYRPKFPVILVPKRVPTPLVNVTVGRRTFELKPGRITKPAGVLLGGLSIDKERGLPQSSSRFPGRPMSSIIAYEEIADFMTWARGGSEIEVELTLPDGAKPGTNYSLDIYQMVGSKLAGGYSVFVTVV